MKYFIEEFKERLAGEVASVLGVNSADVKVEYPNEKVDADLAVPVFRFAGQKSKSPDMLAKETAENLSLDEVSKVEAVGGFVNVWIKPQVLAGKLLESNPKTYGNHAYLDGQQILVEHTDPNPFKELHIGHAYSNTVGESLARLHEAAGAEVVRLTYQGDVGLHIAKAVWAMAEEINWDGARIGELDLTDNIGRFYAHGNEAYEGDAKENIEEVNRKIYSGDDELINRLYESGREKSFAYFDEVYEKFGVKFDTQIMESESAPKGIEIVKANTPGVFKENDGAVIYEGEQDGLHTRVFINSQGLPTYEAKDLGLMEIKHERWPETAKSIILTANEVDAYFKVVLAAMKRIKPELADKTVHLSHGVVRLPEGKMSSRTGNVKTALSLLADVKEAVKNHSDSPQAVDENVLAAIKYAFLKPAVGGDIVYNVNESISLEGQTGPYVQYAAVRVQSILNKVEAGDEWGDYSWEAEKELLKLLSRYPEVTKEAIEELSPHLIAQFVYDLARELNRYYEHVNVKDASEEEKAARVALLKRCRQVFEHGLGLMNIPAPEKM